MYAFVQTLNNYTFISVSKKNEKCFKSNLCNDVAGDLYATHLVYKCDDTIASCSFENSKLNNWLKEHNAEPVGGRFGWTGWQVGKTDSDKKKMLEAAQKKILKSLFITT